MDYVIHHHRISKSQVIVIVIGQEAWKIGKAQLDSYFSWEKQHSHGHPRNNLLLHYPHVKQNTLLLHHVCVMQYD